MKVTFLGTGTSQGVPVIACGCAVCQSTDRKDKRLRASVLLEIDDIALVIDAGPDFRAQMLHFAVKKLDAVLVTHSHKDHIGGLDDVRAFNFIQRKAMPIFADAATLEGVKRELAYAFDNSNYPGVPQIELCEFAEQPFECCGINLIPIPVTHYTMQVKGFRLANFAYVTDANYIPPESMDKLRNLDVLTLNALRKEKHISHFNLDKALRVIEQLKPKQAYLTHISHLMGKQAEVSLELPENVAFAYDGLTLYL